MDTDRLWAEIDDQRRRTADLLVELDGQDWQQRSLCDGWRIRDVAAHLTLQQSGFGDIVGTLRRSPGLALRGDMNGLIRREAIRRAEELDESATVDAIRQMIGSRRHNLGVTPYETLIDICVHSQDIAVPLGRELPLHTIAAATAAQRAWQRGWPWYPRRRHAGRRFVATDCDWSVGEGTDIHGPIEAILLVLTGREVGWRRLAESPHAVIP